MARVYLGGPIAGLSYEEARNGPRVQFARLLHPSIEPLSPMRQEGMLAEIKELRSVGYGTYPLHTNRGIVTKDCLDINRSDVVVMNFQGAKKPSLGSVWEMGYAVAKGKPLVLIMDKDRENDPHTSCFVLESGIIVFTVQDAADIVNGMLVGGV